MHTHNHDHKECVVIVINNNRYKETDWSIGPMAGLNQIKDIIFKVTCDAFTQRYYITKITTNDRH